MSCAIEMKATLIIDDNERGYQEWEEGDDIHLNLSSGNTVFGEIKQILGTELTIETEDGEDLVVSFEDIEGYL
ncbi:hypothetical protein KQI86_19265 [Clostridium sp. MSJ-11]|uniref:Uncharacterized protein n=1 Tax=Clostridium mobile TaxID=2841512 RepID=A0ABS6EPY6_9CLOT|nr:hypothetical protein [Clostridium mobile]MBU5486444.1 hypothetical protein [Clostridium mobile]